MNSVPLEMDDIFGEFGGEDDDEGGFNPSRLPDLEDELEPMRDMRQDEDDQAEEDLTDNAELLAKLKSMKGASKNTTKRTMPKLDAARLTGERGMAILPKTFERVKLKGRNHEAEDLKVIMHNLQHWGHRLFPKMTFDEILERVERLGAKKEVQTCLKKIRLDIPVLASDMVDDEEDTVQRAGDENEAISREESHQESSRLNGSHDEISDEELEDLLRDQGQPVTSHPVSAPSQNSAPQSANAGLSEEVRKRIEENKRKAMERRAAKMAASNKKRDADVSNTNEVINANSNTSDKDRDISNSTEDMQMEITEGVLSSDNNSLQVNQSSMITCEERSPSNSKAGNAVDGTEPFQIQGAEEDAAQPESMDWADREITVHNGGCNSSKDKENNLKLKDHQEQEEVRNDDQFLDQSTKIIDECKEKQDEKYCNKPEIVETN
ncbi:TIMELESS-interacting protein [Elysia marginata]|uniref:TIMELESS-interacting protein n=1 Tax=Elysia marginata TaxID=1093978 RepID=A0AAV4JX35_9GAST|nr:TIMELESS-interacting protein [Elysia marginata]